MFVVKSDVPKDNIIQILQDRIDRLKNHDLSCPTGTPTFSYSHNRWIIPGKITNIFHTSALRLIKLMEYLLSTDLRHITRRDLWYAVTTAAWGLYNPKLCPKCGSIDIRSEEKYTGRKRKDDTKIMTTDLICNECEMVYTDLTNPYDSMGNDISLIERITGIEKEDLGLHAGQKGFLYGSGRMKAYSRTRSYLELQASPTIMFDLPKLMELQGFSKILLLEKESFVSHLVPIGTDERPDFTFLECIDSAIITSQGYEGKYNKSFVRLCLDNGITPFSLHDGDGIEMDLILQHHSQSGAHLPDYLITNPHRMGFFPSVGIATGCPSTPMTKKHIRNLELQQKRIEKIGDPLYEPEIEILLEQGERWELQSMGAIHTTAGQAYIIEYMRNRNILLKPRPDLNQIRKEFYETFTRNVIKDGLEEDVDYYVREHIQEKLVDKIIKQIMDSDTIKDAIFEVVDELDYYPELPDNETLLEIWEDKLSSYITATTESISNMVVNSLCDVTRNVEIDEDAEIIETDEDGRIIIDPEKLIESITIEAERNFTIPEPKEERPDLYGDAIRRSKIDYMTCIKFREALKEKLADFPPEDDGWEIPEDYDPDEQFDELNGDDDE